MSTIPNFQAWCHCLTGYVAHRTSQVNQLLCTEAVKTCIVAYLKLFEWVGAPWIFLKMAPLSFTATLTIGLLGGVFSRKNMQQIIDNKAKILAGGVADNQPIDNTSFKVSLIFLCIILNHSFPFPSLQILYAAGYGLHVGMNLGILLPETLGTTWAQMIDKLLPFLPTCNPPD